MVHHGGPVGACVALLGVLVVSGEVLCWCQHCGDNVRQVVPGEWVHAADGVAECSTDLDIGSGFAQPYDRRFVS